MSDGKVVESRIQKENPIFFCVTHQLISCLNIAFDAYAQRLRIIETVRHPLFLLDHWLSYMEMLGNNVRDFTVWQNFNGSTLPWFTDGWEKTYIESTNYDKVIYTIKHLMTQVFNQMTIRNENKSILYIPFEKFVLEPEPYLIELENYLETKRTYATKKVLKKQRLPRASINAGPQKHIYKRYGVNKQHKNMPDKQSYEMCLASAKQKSSDKAFNELIKITKQYEDIFGLWF